MESEETGCFGRIVADPAAATVVIIVGVPIEAAVAVTAAEVPIVAADLIEAEGVVTEDEIVRSTESEQLSGLPSQEGSLFSCLQDGQYLGRNQRVLVEGVLLASG